MCPISLTQVDREAWGYDGSLPYLLDVTGSLAVHGLTALHIAQLMVMHGLSLTTLDLCLILQLK